MCRSPLPNKIQPSAMRWRVGRKPTSRSIALTSCHGQPVSAARAADDRSVASATLVKTMVRDGVMARGFLLFFQAFSIVAFVTYGSQDATVSQQRYGNSNLATFGRGWLVLLGCLPMLGVPGVGAGLLRR